MRDKSFENSSSEHGQNDNELKEPKSELQTIPEYSYDEGLATGIDIITERLKKQRMVVVAFSAAGRNVGKTKLALDMMDKLSEQGFESTCAHVPKELEIRQGEKPAVFIIDQMAWGPENIKHFQKMKGFYDRKVKTTFEKLGYNVNGIDLWIGLCSPDHPFAKKMESGDEAKPMADIIIMNTKANDKDKIK